MNIVTKPIGAITPYERNPRNNEKAVDAVAKSIKEFGFKVPLVIDGDGVVVAGHTRLKAAQKLGLTEVPCIVADDLTPEQIKAFRIADNKTAELAEWNMELLPIELRELESAGFDMDALAFDTAELETLLHGDTLNPGETEPDAVPEPPEEPKSVAGEVYVLGEHRLMCGDSTSADDIAKLMCGEKAELYLTDPPYNVHLEGSNGLTIMNDKMDSESFLSFLKNAFKPAADALIPGGVFYIYHGDTESVNFRLAAADAGLVVHSTLYWVKDSFNLNFADYHPRTESILYGWKEGAPHAWYSDRAQSNVLEFRRPLVNDVHPSKKSVEMLVYLVKNSSKTGGIVLDNFGGSGSTLIACEQTGRKCRMMELDPKYCDVIRKRWAEFKHGEGCDWESLTPVAGSAEGGAENE